MSILIAAILFGLGFAYFATQNTDGVTLKAGGYVLPAIPAYLVILSSLLIGLIIAWILSSISWVSSMMTIRGKDSKIRHTETTVNKLESKIRELELENSKLRGEKTGISQTDRTITRETPRRNFFDKFRDTPTK